MKNTKIIQALYWLGITNEKGEIFYSLFHQGKKQENIGKHTFDSAIRSATFLEIPIICLN
jgi:hypothetical protein